MYFRILGEVEEVEIIAVGSGIRELGRLKKIYGAGRSRKLKGIAPVQFPDGTVRKAEIHCYEAHGIGKKELKVKPLLD